MAKPGGGVSKKFGSFGGGSGKMHKFAGAGTQEPGVSSQEGHSTGRRDQKAKAGGSSVMGYSSGASNASGAGPQQPGQSAQLGPRGGKFAEGGSTKMFGNRGSQRSEAGKSSP